MGFLSGLFGGGSSDTSTKVEIPEFIQNLGKSLEPAALTALGATPGSGTVAGFSPDRLAAFNAQRQLATGDPTRYFKNAAIASDNVRQAGGAFDKQKVNAGMANALVGMQGASADRAADRINAQGAFARDADSLIDSQGGYGAAANSLIDSQGRYADAAGNLVNQSQGYLSNVFASPNERRESAFDDQLTAQVMKEFDFNQDRQRAGLERDRLGRSAFGTRADLAQTEDEVRFGDARARALSELLEGQISRRTDASRLALEGANTQLGIGNQSLAAANAKLGVGNQTLDAARAKLGIGGQALDAAGVELGVGNQNLQAANTQLGIGGQNIDAGRARLAQAQTGQELAQQQRATGIDNARLLEGIGGQYEARQQQMLNAPFDQAARLASIVNGTGTNQTSSTDQSRDPLSTIASLSLIAGGFFKDGGMVRTKPGKCRCKGRCKCGRQVKKYADGGAVTDSGSIEELIEKLRAIRDPSRIRDTDSGGLAPIQPEEDANVPVNEPAAQNVGVAEQIANAIAREGNQPGQEDNPLAWLINQFRGNSESPEPTTDPAIDWARAQQAQAGAFVPVPKPKPTMGVPIDDPAIQQSLLAPAPAGVPQQGTAGGAFVPVPQPRPQRGRAQAPAPAAPATAGIIDDPLMALLQPVKGEPEEEPGRMEKWFNNPLTIAGLASLADPAGGISSLAKGGLAAAKFQADKRNSKANAAKEARAEAMSRRDKLFEVLMGQRTRKEDQTIRRTEREEDRADRLAREQAMESYQADVLRLRQRDVESQIKNRSSSGGAQPRKADQVTQALLDSYIEQLVAASDPSFGDPEEAARLRGVIAQLQADAGLVEMGAF